MVLVLFPRKSPDQSCRVGDTGIHYRIEILVDRQELTVEFFQFLPEPPEITGVRVFAPDSQSVFQCDLLLLSVIVS